ncbi:hypothetical protein AOH328_23570 [Helicobacter pylori]
MQYAHDGTAKRGKEQQGEKQGAYSKTFGIKTQWRSRNQNIEEQKEDDGQLSACFLVEIKKPAERTTKTE